MCTKKQGSVKKTFTNGLNMDLSLRARVEKTVDGVEIHCLSNKAKFPVAEVS